MAEQKTEQKKEEQKTEEQTKGKGPTPKGTKRKRYPKLSTDKLTEIIDKLGNGEKVDINTYKQSTMTLNKIRQELTKPRRHKKEDDLIPNRYFSPKSIMDRVDNILWDRGYKKIEDNK